MGKGRVHPGADARPEASRGVATAGLATAMFLAAVSSVSSSAER